MEKSLGTLYEEIGGMETCRRLSRLFHDRVEDDPGLRKIFPGNLTATTEHLALFLAERLGGPSDYTARRGKNSLVCKHAHLAIGPAESTAWLKHMSAAIDAAGIPESAGSVLREFFSQTAPTLSDPFLSYYSLPLDALQKALTQNPELASACASGRSLLKNAAAKWDLPRVRMLVEFGADVHVRDALGHDPLYHAAGAQNPQAIEEGSAVIKLLVQRGANVNGQSGPGRMTPLHMAARRGTTAIAEVLLESGAEIEAKDAKGETPLRRAVNCGQEGVVRLLMSRGANPLSQDKQGRTPLDTARQEGIRNALLQATEN